MAAASLRTRLDRLDWPAVEADLEKQPYARLGRLLTAAECRQLTSLFTDEACFRSRIDMERHRFGVGEYKYFANPLPPLVEDLRNAAYPHLARVANRWAEALGTAERFPDRLEPFLARCHAAGQKRPTPLLLRYESRGVARALPPGGADRRLRRRLPLGPGAQAPPAREREGRREP